MPGPQGAPSMQGGGSGYYGNRGRGGGNAGRGNNRRRRPNNQQGQQQASAKYTQANGFQEDAEFQPKLPSDTAPAFRFVERRGRRNKGGAGNAGPGGQQNHHHGGQGGARHHTRDPAYSKSHTTQQPASKPAGNPSTNRQENVTPKTLRIVPASSKPEAPEESLKADTSFSSSSIAEKTSSQEAGSTPPTLPEPVEARSKPQLEPGQDTTTDAGNIIDDEDGGVPVSWTMASDAQSEVPTAATDEKTASDEPKKISIRELLDTSDIIEPITMSKPPFLPSILIEPSTPANNQPSGVFSSPLTITKTPFNPNNPQNGSQEPTPLERFYKLSDVTSRYLTERLGDIKYNPDLSRRLKSDFEVIESAYNALPFDRSVNPNRIIWHTLLGLKKAVELRNNDAKIVGALKKMTQTYDTVRHQALHERRFDGDLPFGHEAGTTTGPTPSTAGKWDVNSGIQAIAKSGEMLMDTVKWNIRGGDTNVRLCEGNGKAGHATMGFGNPGFGASSAINAGFGPPSFGNPSFNSTHSGAPGFGHVGFRSSGFNLASIDTTGFGTPSFRPPDFVRAPSATAHWGARVDGSILSPAKANVPPPYGIIGGHLK
ncbi:hypothetical protein TWF718_009345 [Orbilia javanica]|uniref:Uncharacterized protein n=1 Tax=Orbilia javanica TaxID=47235 RepID=A0AAN8N2T8_9PEZI